MIERKYGVYAVPAGAAAGWLSKKALQLSGDLALREAEKVANEAQEITSLIRSDGEALRKRLVSRLATFSAVLAAHLGTRPVDGGLRETYLPDPVLEKLEHAFHAALSGGFWVTNPVPSFKRPSAMKQSASISYANFLAQTGDYGGAFFTAASSNFEDGASYRADCSGIVSEVKASAKAAVAGAYEWIEGLRAEIDALERDWDELITPRLRTALASPDPDLTAVLHDWARKLEAAAREHGHE